MLNMRERKSLTLIPCLNTQMNSPHGYIMREISQHDQGAPATATSFMPGYEADAGTALNTTLLKTESVFLGKFDGITINFL